MTKPRHDSTWNKLTPAQKETLDGWLFELNLGYEEVLQRAQNEWGFTGSKSSLSRYYHAVARKRLREELDEVHETVKAARDSKLDLDDLGEGVLKMIGKRLVEAALQHGEARELPRLAELLLQHRQQEIQRNWFALAREKFQFKASKAALNALPLVDEFTEDDQEREQARIKAVRRILFGPDERTAPYAANPCNPASSRIVPERPADFATPAPTESSMPMRDENLSDKATFMPPSI